MILYLKCPHCVIVRACKIVRRDALVQTTTVSTQTTSICLFLAPITNQLLAHSLIQLLRRSSFRGILEKIILMASHPERLRIVF